jgi:hypothetical protein
MYVPTLGTWAAGRAACQSLGLDLASIHSAAENAAVRAIIAVSNTFAWIGATDEVSEGTWGWSDGTPWDYSNWAPSEPNSYLGADEDCAVMYGTVQNGPWNDAPCSGSGVYGAVCRVTPSPPPPSPPPPSPSPPTWLPFDPNPNSNEEFCSGGEGNCGFPNLSGQTAPFGGIEESNCLSWCAASSFRFCSFDYGNHWHWGNRCCIGTHTCTNTVIASDARAYRIYEDPSRRPRPPPPPPPPPPSRPPPPRLPPSTTIVGSGSIVGNVTSASLLDYVRATRPCASPRAPRRGSLRSHAPQACSPTCPVLIHSGARSLARSHVLSTQANFVAVSGSYAYVTGMFSDSLVVVDISNPASPVIRGMVSSSLLDHVRVTQSRGARMASGAALASATRASYSHPRRHSLHLLSRTYSFTLTCCAHSLITSP